MATSPFDRAEIDLARAHLEQLGYRIEIRRNVWIECRMSSNEEDWVGRGSDEAEAFTHALALLFPSRAARVAFREQIGSSARRKSVPVQPPSQPPASVDEPTRQRPALTATPEFSLDAPTIELPAVSSTPPSKASDVTQLDPPIAAGKKMFDEQTTAEFTILSDAERTRPPTVAGDVLRDLEELRFRVLAAEAQIALMAPELQRLHLLGWMARARELEAAVSASPAVEFAAGTVVALLARMARAYATPPIHALARTSTPAAAGEDLESAAPPESWQEVAAKTAQLLNELADGRGDGDEYGWSDASALLPAPAEPDAMLERVRAVADKTDPAPSADLEDAARRARWSRMHAHDDIAWGSLMGTLRRVAARHPELDGVASIIEPGFRPSDSWAALIGGATSSEPPLAERVRAKVSGRRLLFVAHREDPSLAARLERTLRLAVEWTASDARLSEHSDRARRRAYDFVVSALGFRSPSAERELAAACSKANVPLLRIDEPGLVACTRALARELGLLAEAGGARG